MAGLAPGQRSTDARQSTGTRLTRARRRTWPRCWPVRVPSGNQRKSPAV